MKKIIIFYFLLFVSDSSFAQQITFQKVYGTSHDDYLYSIAQAADSGFFAVGTTNPSSFAGDCFIVKTNATGGVLWKKVYGGANDDGASSGVQTSDGGFIFTGYTNSFGNGDYDIYLVKINSAGNVLWSKTYGGTGTDEGMSVHQTFDGGYIITGEMNVFGAGTDVFLIKTDPSGNINWANTYGGQGDEYNNVVRQTADSGYIITGSTSSFGAGGSDDIYVLKTDVVGDTLWSRTFGGAGDDDGGSVEQTDDGGFIITGSTASFTSDWDCFLIKTDVYGNLLWTKTYDAGYDDISLSVQQTTDGGYIMAGGTTSFGPGNKVLSIKTDTSGNPLWTKIIATGGNWGFDVQKTNDGGYIIAGNSYGGVGPLPPNFYLIKTDSSGNSGCNEVNLAVTSSAPATIVTYPTFDVSPASLTVLSQATLVANAGSVTTICGPVGIQSLIPFYQSEISINPNPSNGNFIIHFNNILSEKTIQIFDVTGNIIYKKDKIKNAEEVINLTTVAKGIYFLKVFDKNKITVDKIVIH